MIKSKNKINLFVKHLALIPLYKLGKMQWCPFFSIRLWLNFDVTSLTFWWEGSTLFPEPLLEYTLTSHPFLFVGVTGTEVSYKDVPSIGWWCFKFPLLAYKFLYDPRIA